MRGRWQVLFLALVVALPAAGPLLAAGPRGEHKSEASSPPELRELLERFDRVQESIRTLSADFTQTTSVDLLKEPLEAKGSFFLTKPSSVRWEYTTPETMRFVIAGDQYLGFFPARKRAERRDIHRWSDQIFRFFGVGQGSAELCKFYDIRLGAEAGGPKGARLLVLEPKKRRVRKRVEEVRLWIDRASLLPVTVEYSEKGGFTRVLRFHNLRVNPDLSASLYRMEIPADYVVTDGFSGLGAVSAATPR